MTRETLMGSLLIVVRHEPTGHPLRLLQGGRPIQAEALLLIGAVRAFDQAVLLGMTRRTDLNVDAQTGPQSAAMRPENHCLRDCPREPHIAIQRNALGTTILQQGVGQGCSGRLSGKIGTHMGIKQNGGPMSMILRVSTTCCRLPCGSAGTLETSLQSICQHLRGAGRSWTPLTGVAMR